MFVSLYLIITFSANVNFRYVVVSPSAVCRP